MKNFKRLLYSAWSCFYLSPKKRTEFFRKKHVFGHIGKKCSIQDRMIPLYSNLIYLHNNVRMASNVVFVTHDIIHMMLNNRECDDSGYKSYIERVGCIEVMDNVFIGTGVHILYGVRIGTNVIIGSGSLVNKDVPDNCVYAGVPARYICSFDDYMKKAKAQSEQFKKQYGINRVGGVVSDQLAAEIYADFCKKREKQMDKE